MLASLRSRVLAFSRTHPSLFPPPSRGVSPLPPSGLPRSLRPGHLLAVNLGKNKTSAADSNEDYIRGVRLLGPYADVVVINVSSPNTPGLRALQGREVLEKLLTDVVEERNKIKVDGLPKIAVKVACDLSEEELGDVASAVRRSGVEGVIVSNTTIKRDGLGLQSGELAALLTDGHVTDNCAANAPQIGGLSGKPLFPLALQAVKTIRPLLPPSIPVIGCGGISTSSDAISMARSGASIVQLYTSFMYRGIGTPGLLKDEISADLVKKGETWKGQIGHDWPDREMGWDEKRLEKESQALKKEAEDLGQMLRESSEEKDLARLIDEAEKAIKGTSSSHFSKESSSERTQSSGARDNLAGATPNGGLKAKAEKVTDAKADDGKAEDEQKASSTSTSPIPTSSSESLKGGVEVSRPLGGLLGPIVVSGENLRADAPPPPAKKPDAFTGAVKTGNKRLV